MNELKLCKCGEKPELITTYDTEQIKCPNCGNQTQIHVGDYYDEGLWMEVYTQYRNGIPAHKITQITAFNQAVCIYIQNMVN